MGTPDLSHPFCMPCGKRSFPSRQAAEGAGHAYARKNDHRSRKRPRQVYECGSGNGWHLSSSTLTRRARR